MSGRERSGADRWTAFHTDQRRCSTHRGRTTRKQRLTGDPHHIPDRRTRRDTANRTWRCSCRTAVDEAPASRRSLAGIAASRRIAPCKRYRTGIAGPRCRVPRHRIPRDNHSRRRRPGPRTLPWSNPTFRYIATRTTCPRRRRAQGRRTGRQRRRTRLVRATGTGHRNRVCIARSPGTCSQGRRHCRGSRTRNFARRGCPFDRIHSR